MAQHSDHLPLAFRRPGSEQNSRSSLDIPRSKSHPDLQQLEIAHRPKRTKSHSLIRRDSFASDSSTSLLDLGRWHRLTARPLALWEKGTQQDSIQPIGNRFCDDCRNLNLEKWIHNKMKQQLTIGRWKDIRENCPFCRLVIDCVLQSGEHVADHKYILLDNELSWRLCIVYSLYDGNFIEGYSNARDLRATAKRTSGKNAYRLVISLGSATWLGQIQYVADTDPVTERKFFGRRVDQRFPNLKLICEWLPRCQQIHGRSCDESGEAAKRLPKIRVVDVHRRIVITAPDGCRYVTLSYVWGNCNHWKASESNVYRDRFGRERIDLPEHLPQTLEDAIYVTQELGERYLWVDALCIIQDRKSEKHAQILRMDAIYSSSVITIAAASGPNANSGLAGISRSRRVPQRTEVVDGLRFALPLPDYTSLEDDTSLLWNLRGWTFQEKVLSKRLLLFTDYQVYFQCSNTVFCEDTAMETDLCSASTKKKWRPLRWASDRLVGEQTNQAGANLSNYMSVIREYTKRTITDPCDGVDAIQGVLGTLEFEMGSFYHGMPVEYFGPALLWQPPLGSSSRRLRSDYAPFPSWSWARWSIPEGVVWQSSMLTETYLTYVAFLLFPDLVNLVPLNAPASDPIHRRGWWRSTPKYVTNLPEGEQPPPVSLSQEEDRLLRKIGCMLYINSSLVQAHIGRRVRRESYSPLVTSDHYCHYELVDANGSCVGNIWMSASTRSSCGSHSLELITICEGIGYDGAPIADHYIPTKKVGSGENERTVNMKPFEFPIANVVLVKWAGNVAQRVALGTIVRKAWIECIVDARWILFG